MKAMNTYMCFLFVFVCCNYATLVQSVRYGLLKVAEDGCNEDSCENCFANNYTFCLSNKHNNLCCLNRSAECIDEIFTPNNCSAASSSSTTQTQVPTSTSTASSTETTPESTSTVAPATVPTKLPPHSRRHFDAPSFIGGIVLSLGILAIVYVSFKFYKARTERNYHTL